MTEMTELNEINGRYHALYSFFRSKACYEALTPHISKLDTDTTHPFIHIYNLLIQDVFLSWCKVFGSHSENCHWKKLIKEHEDFKIALFSELRLTETEFGAYWESVIDFRNNWVVHSDPNHKHRPVPYFDIAFRSAKVLFYYIINNYSEYFEYAGPKSIDEFIENVKNDFTKQLKIRSGCFWNKDLIKKL